MTPELDPDDVVTIDPNILHGEAHVKGTRVPVRVILDSLAAGLTEDDVLREYPTLTIDGIRAAKRHAQAG